MAFLGLPNFITKYAASTLCKNNNIKTVSVQKIQNVCVYNHGDNEILNTF